MKLILKVIFYYHLIHFNIMLIIFSSYKLQDLIYTLYVLEIIRIKSLILIMNLIKNSLTFHISFSDVNQLGKTFIFGFIKINIKILTVR